MGKPKNHITKFLFEKYSHLTIDKIQDTIAADYNNTININKKIDKSMLSKGHRHKMNKKNRKTIKYGKILEQQVSNLVPALEKIETERSLIKESESFKNPVEVINNVLSNNSTMDLMTKFETSSSATAPEITDSSSVTEPHAEKKLRPIIIDALNIGHSYSLGQFSATGVEICVDYFINRGHNDIVVFIPQQTEKPHYKNQKILKKLQKKAYICYTPCRIVQGIRMTCYDDRIMLNYALEHGGVIISNDNYKDLFKENEAFRDVILNRVVKVKFENNEMIVPEQQYNPRYCCFKPQLSEMLQF